VLPARPGGALDATLDALGSQTRAPDEVFPVRHAAAFQHAMWGGLDGGTEWFWLLDGSVVPEPRALESLLDAVGRVEELPDPVLLASKVVTEDGSPDPEALPVPQVFDPDLVMSVFDARLLPVRVARRGSLLVHRRGFREHGIPRLGAIFFGEDLVWIARMLKSEPGLLVPASVVVRRTLGDHAAAKRRRESVAEELRLLLSDGLNPGEKPWFAGRLAEELLGVVRPR
jgi:hypothetical protein